jgi:hypothetical protein
MKLADNYAGGTLSLAGDLHSSKATSQRFGAGDVPYLEGGENARVFDCDDKHQMVLLESVDKNEFIDYCKKLGGLGFELDSENGKNGNMFKTYYSSERKLMLHTYWIEHSGEVRTVAANTTRLPANDTEGKKITAADGVANAIAILGTNVTIENATIENKGGTVFTIGYVADAEETVAGVAYTADVTLKNTTVTSAGTAYAVKHLADGNLILSGATIDGAAKNETVSLVKKDTPVDPGTQDTEPVETQSTETQPTETKPADTTLESVVDTTPDTTDGGEKGGCGSAIGMSVIAVLAVAGMACGIASKKRED